MDNVPEKQIIFRFVPIACLFRVMLGIGAARVSFMTGTAEWWFVAVGIMKLLAVLEGWRG
jgi:hypothetical protein